MFMFNLNVMCYLIRPYFTVYNLDKPACMTIQPLMSNTGVMTVPPHIPRNSVHFDIVSIYS